MSSGTFDGNFETFVSTLYGRGIVPPVIVVPHEVCINEWRKRSNTVPVLMQDESEECSVFGNWSNWYEFEAWMTFRQHTDPCGPFAAMLYDITQSMGREFAWGAEVSKWADMLYALSTLRKKYLQKFGHEPVNMHKFMRSFRRFGEETVLSADRY